VSIDEIVQAMKDFIASVTPAEGGDPQMTEEQAARYEELEKQLVVARRTSDLMKRHAAYVNVAPPAVASGMQSGDDSVERAFDSYLRTGRPSDVIQRAQGEGVASAGGFLVPEGFRATIIEKMKAFGGLQGVSDGISTDSGQPLPWPTNDDTSNLGAVTAESASLGTGADLVFGTKMLGAYTYTSNGASNAALKVPYELLQDSAFDLSGFVGRKLGERIARKLATDLVNGTGAGEPTGLLSAAGGLSTATATAAVAPTYAELLTIVHSVDPAYRDGAGWVFNDAYLKTLRGIVDTTGRPLLWDTGTNLTADLRGGQTLMGFPVTIDQACPTAVSGTTFGFFGDTRKAFIVRSVKDVSLVTLMEKYAENRQVAYMAWARFDSAVQDTAAGVLLKVA
jgi:HK97 family phage major capsid protein